MADQADENKESIFNSSEETPESSKPETATAETLLAGIKAEDGRQKYSNTEEAIKALAASQEHIRKLEAEAAELREVASNAKAVDDVLEELRQANTGTETTTSPAKVDAKELEAIVDNRLKAQERALVAAKNEQRVRDALTEKYGDKAEEVYINAAKEAGVSIDHLNSLSATSSTAALKLIGLDVVPTDVRPSSGSINTESLRPAKEEPNPKVKSGMTRDMVSAWRAAGEAVSS